MVEHIPWNEEEARRRLETAARLRGGLLEGLRSLQETFGFVDQLGIDLAADVFNLSRAEVFGVVNFYDDFRERPADLPVVRICMGEACQAVGAAALEEAARGLGGKAEVGEVFCLGNCACGPAVLIDGSPHGRVTEEKLEALVSEQEGALAR